MATIDDVPWPVWLAFIHLEKNSPACDPSQPWLFNFSLSLFLWLSIFLFVCIFFPYSNTRTHIEIWFFLFHAHQIWEKKKRLFIEIVTNLTIRGGMSVILPALLWQDLFVLQPWRDSTMPSKEESEVGYNILALSNWIDFLCFHFLVIFGFLVKILFAWWYTTVLLHFFFF